LTIIGKDQKLITIDPAKHFILESALASFQGTAVLIYENSVPKILKDVRLATVEEICQIWINNGFNHLKLAAQKLAGESFQVFMRNFIIQLKSPILDSEPIRQNLVKTLVELGENLGLLNREDYLNIIRSILPPFVIAVVLEVAQESIKTLLNSSELKYGSLISFKVDDKITIAAIQKLGLVAELNPLLEMRKHVSSVAVAPLPLACEGSQVQIGSVINDLYSKFDPSFIKIPIGKITGTDKDYYVILKANELIHFALIAISGSGKGNILKLFLFELLRQQAIGSTDDSIASPKLGVVLFDDVGEYVKSLKPKDWGLNLASLVLKIIFPDFDVRRFISFIEVGGKITDNGIPVEYQYCTTQPKFIPIEYIPLSEVLAKINPEAAGSNLLSTYLNKFYDLNEYKHLRNSTFDDERLCVEFLNWFPSQRANFSNQGSRDEFLYPVSSFDMNLRILKDFMINNKRFMGIEYNRINKTFKYHSKIEANIPDRMSINPEYNLIIELEKATDEGKILILDESALPPRVKLFLQRVLLTHTVKRREDAGYDENIIPCLFVIEEATALMRGQGSQQLDLFAEVQVRARKFGVGIGLVLQDIKTLDPSLLTQLGWMIAMGLPVNSMRSLLFSNVPADLGPFDDYIKHADIGHGVGFQKLIGKNSPLPVEIYHFERKVKEFLIDSSIWEGKFEEYGKPAFKEEAIKCKIPKGVIDNILSSNEESDTIQEEDK
jgi:DNA helicase HerA-like ATPase